MLSKVVHVTTLLVLGVVVATLLVVGVVCDVDFDRVNAQTSEWFTVVNGDTSCRANTATIAPLKFYIVCQNPRGEYSGSYTANAANTATDGLTIGLQNGSASTGAGTCMFGINATPNAITMGQFGSIPPQTVAYNCTGQSGASGQTSLAPPPASLKKGKK